MLRTFFIVTAVWAFLAATLLVPVFAGHNDVREGARMRLSGIVYFDKETRDTVVTLNKEGANSTPVLQECIRMRRCVPYAGLGIIDSVGEAVHTGDGKVHLPVSFKILYNPDPVYTFIIFNDGAIGI